MKQRFFSIHFRRYSQLGFFFFCAYFAYLLGAGASDSCPKMDDHSLSAVRYQLFTAFQTGYDGYEAACDLKCFSKEQCQKKCQTEKGLASLKIELDKLKAKKNLSSCPSYTLVCLEQCQQHGELCNKACGAAKPMAHY